MSNRHNVVALNPAAALIEEAKQERRFLIEQIKESQKMIERSRDIIIRLDQALARAARL
jgi:hypothetical protein